MKICSVENCGHVVRGRGYCNRHLLRLQRHGDPLYVKKRVKRLCSIDGCGKAVDAKGYCHSHYNRFKRTGDPLGGGTYRGEPTQWLLEHLDYDREDCLLWPYAKHDFGYGQIHIDGRIELVHVVICTIKNGPKPTPKHEVRHLCGKGHLGCVSVRHLVWGTRQENVDDSLLHGTMFSKEGEVHFKLKFEDVVQIKQMLKYGVYQSKIAEMFGCSKNNISNINTGKNWGWV